MQIYRDLVTDKQVWIRRPVSEEKRQSLVKDGHTILEDEVLSTLIRKLGQQWIKLDETAVELANGDYRNMSQLVAVDSYGNPIP